IPDEIRTSRFTVTIDGHPASFAHAAANYYFLNFDLKGKAKISITAPSDDYWAKGVEVQPWSLNIRPKLEGRTITFTLKHPAKLSITRPGDHLAGTEMLFLFANPPEVDTPNAADPRVRYYAPGVHHENIDAHTGDTIYLAPGAVIFGSLNIWQVQNVKVFGRGVVVHDGPQDPDNDTGWKHLPNWHCIVMDNARNIEISGITCVVRSRTWMIQMKDSRFITFDNVKVIGGSDANANQDGMDWLGGGDTVVRNVFIRAADDVFAMQGNWEGYGHEAMIIPGHDVTNITVENSVLSTSISNIVRAAWPEKVFNGSNFTLRDSDVIHMGIGACGIPFALLDFWATDGATGHTSGYRFENIRLEDWYSLVQIDQPNPSVRDISFKNIWAIETPSLVPSTLLGDVDGVTFDHVRLADKVVAANADIPLNLESGAQQPIYLNTTPRAAFTYSAGSLRPHQKVTFDASPSGPHIRSYEWAFGDGATATGRKVHHKFPDAAGTLWDNSGRFRVTLKTTAGDGSTDWLYEPVVIANTFHDSDPTAGTDPGLNYSYYELPTSSLDTFPQQNPAATGVIPQIDLSPRNGDDNYAFAFDGFLNIPADGGYTFTLLARDEARLEIDGVTVALSPKPFTQVCGSVGNAVQAIIGSIGLRAGRHAIRVQMTHTTGPGHFALKWQGPGIPLSDIPASALSH
ncbi:MAG TPA: PA14 domain-containing protein, partial [Silvibacterium sp.]|nr:PA14 domain-containing protein [Silvibacterium sp.]